MDDEVEEAPNKLDPELANNAAGVTPAEDADDPNPPNEEEDEDEPSMENWEEKEEEDELGFKEVEEAWNGDVPNAKPKDGEAEGKREGSVEGVDPREK